MITRGGDPSCASQDASPRKSWRALVRLLNHLLRNRSWSRLRDMVYTSCEFPWDQKQGRVLDERTLNVRDDAHERLVRATHQSCTEIWRGILRTLNGPFGICARSYPKTRLSVSRSFATNTTFEITVHSVGSNCSGTAYCALESKNSWIMDVAGTLQAHTVKYQLPSCRCRIVYTPFGKQSSTSPIVGLIALHID